MHVHKIGASLPIPHQSSPTGVEQRLAYITSPGTILAHAYIHACKRKRSRDLDNNNALPSAYSLRMDADWIHTDSDILNIYFFVFSGMEANQICMDTLKILEIYFGVFFPFPSLYSLFFFC